MGEVEGCEGGCPTLYPPPRSQPPSANCTTELRPCNSPPPPPQPYALPPPYACEGGLQAGVGYALGACQGWGAPPPYAPQADMPASLRAMSCCVARIRSSSASWAARRAPLPHLTEGFPLHGQLLLQQGVLLAHEGHIGR